MVDNEIKTRCANYKGHDSDLISFIEGLGLFVCLFLIIIVIVVLLFVVKHIKIARHTLQFPSAALQACGVLRITVFLDTVCIDKHEELLSKLNARQGTNIY